MKITKCFPPKYATIPLLHRSHETIKHECLTGFSSKVLSVPMLHILGGNDKPDNLMTGYITDNRLQGQ